MRRLRWLPIGLLVLGVATAAWLDAHYPWIWAWGADQLRPRTVQAVEGPTHILFTFVDHFEPHEQAALDRWRSSYPTLADRHRDADGRPPQHSWFWYFSRSGEEESLRFLQQLAGLSYEGFGEVELHLHHWNDTEKTFLTKIQKMIDLSQQTGAFLTAQPRPSADSRRGRTAFGFIHGLWALDNSRPGACGVNNELVLLKELGCYADFTHPSWGKMHPRIVNRLYYATDDPQKPKSYDWGLPMKVGAAPVGDLLIFEGPSVVRWRGLRPAYDHGDISGKEIPTAERVDSWIRTGIHVAGRPEWVFVKVFAHGALEEDHEAVLGDFADELYRLLEERYNDGSEYVLHYVTAREAYNIAKAAEAGRTGDPGRYRDFLIPPYLNRFFLSDSPYQTIAVEPQRLAVRFLAPPQTQIQVKLKKPQAKVSGDAWVREDRSSPSETAFALTLKGSGPVEFTFQ